MMLKIFCYLFIFYMFNMKIDNFSHEKIRILQYNNMETDSELISI